MAGVNFEMVEKVSAKIKSLPLDGVKALDFTEEDKFPLVGDPGALNYIFAVTMHDYGFWLGNERGYVEPLYGEVDGKRLKGSDLLWTLSMKIYKERGPGFFDPVTLAVIRSDDFYSWFQKSVGFQDINLRHKMTLLYGTYFMFSYNPELPNDILVTANKSDKPLSAFLELTGEIDGYNKDSIFKKNLLLAMILANRPEKFLHVGPGEFKDPIVDYHLMRVALRLGLINLSWVEYDQLKRRVWVGEWIEEQIRKATFDAVKTVIELSGKPMSEIDFLLWSARKYCPEMIEPNCPKCVFNDVCQKRTDLFQPVFRTTNY